MIGARVWVWFNDKLTVNGQILDNYFDRSRPVLPRGPIELQTHGSEIRFRNIYIREIPTEEANASPRQSVGTKVTRASSTARTSTGWGGPWTNMR